MIELWASPNFDELFYFDKVTGEIEWLEHERAEFDAELETYLALMMMSLYCSRSNGTHNWHLLEAFE